MNTCNAKYYSTIKACNGVMHNCYRILQAQLMKHKKILNPKSVTALGDGVVELLSIPNCLASH